MRRSFPLIMKYPPNSSGSSLLFTNWAEESPRRLHRTDWKVGLFSEHLILRMNWDGTQPTRTMMGTKPHSLITDSPSVSFTFQRILAVIRPRYEVNRSRACEMKTV